MTPRPTPLQREIRQVRPFRSKGHEAVVGLFRTTDVIRRRFMAVLEPFDVTPQQFNVLRILRGAGKEGLPTLEIAERMVEQQPGITRLLDRIEARGWVRRERCVADRRQVLCHISPAGLRLLERLDGPMAAADDATVGSLSRDEQAQLVALLDRLRAGAPGRGTAGA